MLKELIKITGMDAAYLREMSRLFLLAVLIILLCSI